MVRPSGETQLPCVAGALADAVLLPTVTDSDADATLPLLSVACTASVCDPSASVVVSHVQLQDPVPPARCHAPPSTATATDATDTSSAAEPATTTEPATPELDAGEVIVTV